VENLFINKIDTGRGLGRKKGERFPTHRTLTYSWNIQNIWGEWRIEMGKERSERRVSPAMWRKM